jgi:murein DD-endopeptidase MepM/ murein hydrolase activator NlpD
MKISRIIKKLNKTYSVVIIPNNNDSIKKYSLKAPFVKLMFALLIIFTLSIIIVLTKSAQTINVEAKNEALSKEALQQQIQTLSQLIIEQNKSLETRNGQIKELKSDIIANNGKLSEFTKMYTQIADNYITKSNRGSTSKNIDKTGLDLLKLSNIVEDLNRGFNADNQVIADLDISKGKLEKIINAIPTFIPADGKISSPFGMRNHPIKKVNKVHEGVDISSSKDDPILAAASGIVEYSGYNSGYGYHVIIDHKNGFRTLYAHSSKLLVKEGELVKKGQKIALVGSTGLSTGPHLHFEIRIANTPVDPTRYIDFSS